MTVHNFSHLTMKNSSLDGREDSVFADCVSRDRVFVFGSNLAGRHGAGAARFARLERGAVYCRGVGLQGNSYAIPTKDERIRTLPLSRIEPFVKEFVAFAEAHPDMEFEVTRIGCGLAGYKPRDIAPMFAGAVGLGNVSLPDDFLSFFQNLSHLTMTNSSNITMSESTQTTSVVSADISGRKEYPNLELSTYKQLQGLLNLAMYQSKADVSLTMDFIQMLKTRNMEKAQWKKEHPIVNEVSTS